MKSKTINGYRHFTCKRCGEVIVEPEYRWKRKAQKDKNICECCIRKHEIKTRSPMEMAFAYGHRYF